MDRLLAEAERKVKNFVYTNFGVETNDSACKVGVALGRAAEEIVTAALQEEVDVIVLARRKVRTLTRLFTRSISATVSQKCALPSSFDRPGSIGPTFIGLALRSVGRNHYSIPKFSSAAEHLSIRYRNCPSVPAFLPNK